MEIIKIIKGIYAFSILATLALVDAQTANASNDLFIEEIAQEATEISQQYNIYASVMIAQAVLESDFGESQLSQPPFNNFFGIKGNFNGKNIQFNTLEDQGSGHLFSIKSSFRQYPSAKESLLDYAKLLKNGIKGNPYFYMNTWKSNANHYSEATQSLQGAYATDTHYAGKLNRIIEKYNLTQYDQQYVEVPLKYIIIKKGDTISSISKEFNITVDELFIWNKLQSNDIKIGSKLIIAVSKKRINERVSTTEIKRSQTKSMNKIHEQKKKKSTIHTSVIKSPKKYKAYDSDVHQGKKVYKVKNGDSIRSIAKKFNVSEEIIMSLNNLDSTLVYVGQRLILR